MSKEIRDKIQELYQQFEATIDPATFVLNPDVAKIANKIAALQGECKHNFVNGVCEFCDLEEQ